MTKKRKSKCPLGTEQDKPENKTEIKKNLEKQIQGVKQFIEECEYGVQK